MNQEIQEYNDALSKEEKAVCDRLAVEINRYLPKAENKIWHGGPVWFLDGNPVVGYDKQKKGVKLLFWSGESFEEEKLIPGSGKFKDAGIFFNDVKEINTADLKRWLMKSKDIQWDYKNIVKQKGLLNRLK